jgi:hypothetical protein
MGYVKAFAIKNQWINFSLYFVNFMYKVKKNNSRNRVCEWIVSKYRLEDNNKPIGGKQTNNKFLANGETFKTDFIEVDKTDLLNFFTRSELGYVEKKSNLIGKDNYKRADNLNSSLAKNITNQERKNEDSAAAIYNNEDYYYFLKGTNTNDILKYLVSSKVI